MSVMIRLLHFRTANYNELELQPRPPNVARNYTEPPEYSTLYLTTLAYVYAWIMSQDK